MIERQTAPLRKKLADTIKNKRKEMFSDLENISDPQQREILKRKILEEINRESAKIKKQLQFGVETAVLQQNRNEGKEQRSEVVCALAFGSPKSILPNWLIQERLKRFDPEKTFTDVESALPTPLTVTRVVQYLKEHNLKKVVLIAEPVHSLRAKRDLLKIAKREGVEVEIEYDIFLSSLPRKTWFSKQSEQFWTRNVAISRVYERLVVPIIPFGIYLKMAQKETDVRTRGRSIFKKK